MTYPSSSCMASLGMKVNSAFNDFAKCSVHPYDFNVYPSVTLLSLVRWRRMSWGTWFFVFCFFPGSPLIAAQIFMDLEHQNTKIITCGKRVDMAFVSCLLNFHSDSSIVYILSKNRSSCFIVTLAESKSCRLNELISDENSRITHQQI